MHGVVNNEVRLTMVDNLSNVILCVPMLIDCTGRAAFNAMFPAFRLILLMGYSVLARGVYEVAFKYYGTG